MSVSETPVGRNELAPVPRHSQKIRVAIADDHASVREAIHRLLSEDFEVTSVVDGGVALIIATEETQPDAVICDIKMGALDGIQVGRRILDAGTCSAIVLMTMYNDPSLLRSAQDAGIRGFVLKVDAAEELATAIKEVCAGRVFVSSTVRMLKK
jgi:DNA-binding NarL/FixJ family response regulator